MKRLLAWVLLAGCLTGVGFAAETTAQDDAATNATATSETTVPNAPELLADDAAVFVIGKSDIFHLEQCSFIERAKKDGKEIGKDITSTTYAEATAKGLNACKQCIDKDAKKKPSQKESKNAE